MRRFAEHVVETRLGRSGAAPNPVGAQDALAARRTSGMDRVRMSDEGPMAGGEKRMTRSSRYLRPRVRIREPANVPHRRQDPTCRPREKCPDGYFSSGEHVQGVNVSILDVLANY